MELPQKKILIPIIGVIVIALVLYGLFWMMGRSVGKIIEEGNQALQARDWAKAAELFAEAKGRIQNDPQVQYGLVKSNVELALQDFNRGSSGYKNRFRSIEQEAQRLTQLAGDRAESFILFGEVKHHLEQHNAALDAFQQAVRRNRQSFDAKIGIGRTLYQISLNDPTQVSETISALNEALELRQNSEAAHRLLAELYLESGNIESAVSHIEPLQQMQNQLSPEGHKTVGKVLFAQGQYEQARPHLEQGMRISGNVNLNERIENQYLLGTCAFFMEDYMAAGENLEQAKKSAQSLKENIVYPWLQLSQFQTFNALRQKDPNLSTERLNKAADTLEEASRRQAVNPLILKLLAQAYIRLNRFPEARDTLQKLVTVDPENIPARYDLAGLSQQLGDDRSAIEQYQQILERESGHVMANFNLGSIFLARASYQDAVRRLKLAVENDPTFLDARINLAQAYLGRNEYELAKEEYEQALQLNPDNMQAILGLGMIYQRQGNSIEAERYLKTAVEAAPSSDQVRVLLAKLYLQQGNLTSSIRELERAIELNPKNFQAKIQLGNAYLETGLRHNINNAIEIFEQMQENPSPAVKREAMSGLALAMLARGEFDAAQDQFNEILNLPDLSKTDKAQIYVNIGNAYLKQEQYERARTNYEKALSLDRTLAESHYNLGRLYHIEERYADARLKYNMAIGSNPNLAPAHYNLAQLYDQRNNLDKAEEHYEIAMDKDPGLAEAYLNLALLYKKQGRLDEALEQLMQAKKLNPNSSRIRDALSFFYFENGEYDEAREELNYPNPSPQASLIRGMLYYQDENLSQAVAELKRAYTGEAPNPRLMTLVNLGQALVQIGNYPEAELYLVQAEKKAPENPQVLNALGGLYLRTGRYEEAQKVFEQSLENNPDQEQVRQSLDQVEMVFAAP